MTSFSILDNIEKKIKKKLSEVLNTSKHIMGNGAFAVESQPQNPEFRNNPENFHPCSCACTSNE